MPTSKHTSASN